MSTSRTPPSNTHRWQRAIERATKRSREVGMGSIIRRAGLFAAALVAFAGSSAMASTLEVKVPFPFVVHGQTLPAGTYRLETAAIDPAVVLIRGEKGNTAAMLVMTTPAAGHDPAGDKPVLTF